MYCSIKASIANGKLPVKETSNTTFLKILKNLPTLENSVNNINHKKSVSWLTESERKKWKLEWVQKTKAAMSFSKKMNEFQKSLKKRSETINEQLLLTTEENLVNNKMSKEEQKKSFETMKKIYVEKRKEEFEQKRKKTKLITDLANNPSPKKKYLYEKMRERYNSEIISYESQRKQFTRNRSKFNKSEFREHEEKYNKILEHQNETRKKHNEQIKLSSDDYMLEAEIKYNSSFTNKILIDDRLKRNRRKILDSIKMHNHRKNMMYSKLVKERYFPPIHPNSCLNLSKRMR